MIVKYSIAHNDIIISMKVVANLHTGTTTIQLKDAQMHT